jgi:NAD+ synthase (glutamine-hydrolysing)
MVRIETFRDIRTHGFKRLAGIVPVVRVANPLANAEEHTKWLCQAYAAGAQYALLPELSVTGYTCKDKFLDPVLRAAAEEAVRLLAKRSQDWPGMLFTVGTPVEVEGALYNCAATIGGGRILSLHAKTYIPTYGEFEEWRWFRPATMLPRNEISYARQAVPIGNDIILVSEDDPLFKLFVEICEDVWKIVTPGDVARLNGSAIRANPSASNVLVGKHKYRKSLVAAASGKGSDVYAYVGCGPGEDVSDTVWDGPVIIAERGNVIAEAKRYQMKGEMVLTDVNLRVCAQDWLREGTNADNARDFRKEFRTVAFMEPYGRRQDVFFDLKRTYNPRPFVGDAEAHAEAWNALTFAFMNKLQELPEGKRRAILPVSGGADSTLVALLIADGMKKLGLPTTDMIFATMPGYGTTEDTKTDAVDLINALGAELRVEPINDIAKALFKAMRYDPDVEGPKKAIYENPQAWARTMIALSISCKEGGLVIGTGDLSEALQGWCTYLADHASHYHLIIDVPKTQVIALILYARDRVFTGPEHEKLREVLTSIVGREPSPQLMPPDAQGRTVQITDEEIGPKDLRDFFTYWQPRFYLPPSDIVFLGLHAYDGRYDVGTIKRWLGEFIKRRHWSRFKRVMAPPGPKIGTVACSPRGDEREPTNADPAAWLHELKENVPDSLE